MVSWAGTDQPCLYGKRRKRCRHDDRRTGRLSPVMPTRGCGSPPRRFASTPTRLFDARPTPDGHWTCGPSTGSSCDVSGSRPRSRPPKPQRMRSAGTGRHPSSDVIRPAVGTAARRIFQIRLARGRVLPCRKSHWGAFARVSVFVVP